ncbi:MAG: hypothetical protein KGL39_14540 [Patescibacteria group bacterium]|nr:hypothetical protein [Patescibacteria group bacterium]
MNTKLIKAVKKQLGCASQEEFRQTCQAIAQNGAAEGFIGFIYYRDTVAFFDANAEAIYELLDAARDKLGLRTIEDVIASFNSADSIVNEDTRKNLLAWFALEEVARHVADAMEEANA